MTPRIQGKFLLSSSAREDAITCLAFSIGGEYIAIGGLDGKLQIFDLANGQLHYSIVAPSPIKSLIWLPGAEQTLVCACQSGILINIIVRAGVSNLLRPPWDRYYSRITPAGYHEPLLLSD